MYKVRGSIGDLEDYPDDTYYICSSHSRPQRPLRAPMALGHLPGAMSRLLIGFGILAFPFILPIIFSYFMINEDVEVISNEDMWAKDREDRLRMTTTGSRNADGHQTSLYNWPSQHSVSENLHPAPSVTSWYLVVEVINQSIEYSDGAGITTITARGISLYVVGYR